MKSERDKRWRFWTDNTVHGELVVRVVVYWTVCQLAMVVAMVGMSFLFEGSPTSGAGSLSWLLVPGITASAVVLPIALLDTIVFSNRFTGPMMRHRKHLVELAETGSAGGIRIRTRDFYTELSYGIKKSCLGPQQ